VNSEKKLYLHIGIWKTGTTSIQNVLYANKELLSQKGVLYPSISANHTFLASAFHQDPDKFIVARSKNIFGKSLVRWHKESIDKFEKEIEPYEEVVVSSEFLLDIAKDKLNELKDYLSNIFSTITVIVYMRHPVDHVSSAINEQLKQGHYKLEEAYKIHGRAVEYEKVDNWVKVFGKKNIVMRPFEREQFINNDIVDDFLSLIFDDNNLPKIEKIGLEKNQTISFAAVLLANSRIEDGLEGLKKILPSIKGIPYKAPQCVVQQAKKNVEKYLETYQVDFGLKFVKEYDTAVNTPNSEKIWSEETIASIAKILDKNEMVIGRLQSDNHRLNALLNINEGKKEAAEYFFEMAIKSGENYESFRDFSIFLKAGGRSKRALDLCEKAIFLEPNRPWLKVLRKEILGSLS